MKPIPGWKVAGGVLSILAACTLLAALMTPHFDSAGLTMVYLLGVVVTAIAFGRVAAVAAAILSVAIFDFAFVPPRFTFRVHDAQYLVVFAVMLAVALVTGTLTSRLREQREAARASERRTAALYRLSHDLAVRSTTGDVLRAAVKLIGDVAGAPVAAMIPDGAGTLRVAAGAERVIAEDGDRAAAEWAFANGQVAGALSRIPPNARGIHLPLLAGTRILGVLSLIPPSPDTWDPPESMELLRALTAQTALAVERCRLDEEAQRAQRSADLERMRSALLSSVSHDLRTPLAAITGAASGLRSDRLSEAARRDLADAIAEEAERLNRLIANLLDMTRLESGTPRVTKEWHSIEEVVGAALTRLEPELDGRPVRLTFPRDLPLVPMDDALFETVMRNLIENANKYSPPGAEIEVSAVLEELALRLDIADRGPGLDAGEEQRVFEKFYRGKPASGRSGSGLGLAIAKGIVEAHGGTIEAVNRGGGGARFRVRIPLEGPPPDVAYDGESSENPRDPA